MRIQIENWEIERIKEAITKVLNLWQYEFIGAKDKDDGEVSMSKETFFENLERELKNN